MDKELKKLKETGKNYNFPYLGTFHIVYLEEEGKLSARGSIVVNIRYNHDLPCKYNLDKLLTILEEKDDEAHEYAAGGDGEDYYC